jgi:Chromo (CHRromatin Organisation MOdifier) domain
MSSMLGVIQYRVKWAGYDVSDNTWEPAANICDESLINDYWKEKQRDQYIKTNGFVRR